MAGRRIRRSTARWPASGRRERSVIPSLLPQFVAADAPPFLALLALGILFCLMTLAWLTAYAFAVARAGDVRRRSAVRRTIEAVTGIVLVAFGIRVTAAR